MSPTSTVLFMDYSTAAKAHVSGDWQPAHHLAQSFSRKIRKRFLILTPYLLLMTSACFFSSLNQMNFLFPPQLHVKVPGCPTLSLPHRRPHGSSRPRPAWGTGELEEVHGLLQAVV